MKIFKVATFGASIGLWHDPAIRQLPLWGDSIIR